MPYGLLDRDIYYILDAIKALPEISEVVLFGSRAKGRHKAGSDVDLAIKGTSVSYDTAVRLADILNEEKPLPYFFDVIHYESIREPRLLEHIDRVGVVLYSKEEAT
ncbi:nucleotidyltransferase domain-containing protein [Geomonas sp.]|uniref:nucleotidyltransferase family protein n=1 Tax=Geomonas sp. TaxID=2651584 RepID=UPI002B47E887|nr:nucleotidyltransferase domain-containing protein [Geomonas sp.]HJV36086.1 nucleotidyltransferase domain-containing protein [Geomonas sp.]